MSVGIHTVATDTASAVARFNNVDALVLQANSSAEATALSQAYKDGDADAVWGAATVTYLPNVPDMAGWTIRIQVNTSTATDVSVIGNAAETFDQLGTRLAALLVTGGHGEAHAAYNTSTNVLTVAAGASDALGDKTITVTVTPPTGLFPSGYSWAQADVVASKTDGGMSSADLKVTFSTTWVIPKAILGYKQSA